MLQSIRRYHALSGADRSCALEAAMVMIAVRLAFSALRFTVLRTALDRAVRAFQKRPSRVTSHDVGRVAWAVAAVTRRVPFRSTCLIESLTVDAMLRRRGMASEIRFGVLPPGGGALSAHAWVEHDGAVVFGARSDLTDYRVLVPQDVR